MIQQRNSLPKCTEFSSHKFLRADDIIYITDLKFRWTATSRTVTLAATVWGGMTSTWRETQALSFSRGDGQRLFLTSFDV